MAKIAVIGSGISGLSAAYALSKVHEVTVFESENRLGGHARTLTIRDAGRDMAVDTGFIVFNYRNYPHLSALFHHLGVPVQKSTMTFGVSAVDAAGDTIEWGAASPNALFGQRRNLFNPKFYRFLFDILRFNATAVKQLKRTPDLTLGAFLQRLNMSDWFYKYYILPMGGAIWSCGLDTMLSYPAASFVNFFEAHGLLTVTQQPQWYTVTGGSRMYVEKLAAACRGRIVTGARISGVRRDAGRVAVTHADGTTDVFDKVVFACPADATRQLLTDADAEETQVLAPFGFQPNRVILHRDAAQMPARRACWSSWVYISDEKIKTPTITVSYWMNLLQSLGGGKKDDPVVVTLNPITPIDPAKHIDSHDFSHPIYTPDMVAAQRKMATIQGRGGIYHCGAWLKNGFHEDGISSAVDVLRLLGVDLPWQADIGKRAA